MITKLAELVKPVTQWGIRYRRDLFLYACMLLVAGIGYNLGHMNVFQGPPAPTGQDANIYQSDTGYLNGNTTTKTVVSQAPKDPRVVASKNSSSKVYHYTYCSSAARIKDANKIWFDTAAAAETAGYTLAGNCTP